MSALDQRAVSFFFFKPQIGGLLCVNKQKPLTLYIYLFTESLTLASYVVVPELFLRVADRWTKGHIIGLMQTQGLSRISSAVEEEKKKPALEKLKFALMV